MTRISSDIACVAAIAFAGSLIMSAQQTPCDCHGQSKDPVYRGGDRSPLTFYSLRDLEHRGSTSGPVYCYERTVENHSSSEVQDVDWRVAGYYKRFLPRNTPICDVVSVQGDTDNGAGLLLYSPGRGSYQSSSYKPKDGWPAPKQAALSQPLLLAPMTSSLTLQSRITVPVRASGGRVEILTIRFASSVARTQSGFDYTYEIRNEGPLRVWMMWDIPQSEDLKRQFFNPDDGMPLPPKDIVRKNVQSAEAPASAVSRVVITDDAREVVWSSSFVSSYGSAKGTFSTNKLYAR